MSGTRGQGPRRPGWARPGASSASWPWLRAQRWVSGAPSVGGHPSCWPVSWWDLLPGDSEWGADSGGSTLGHIASLEAVMASPSPPGTPTEMGVPGRSDVGEPRGQAL